MELVQPILKLCVECIMEQVNLLEALKIRIDCDEHRILSAEIHMSGKYYWLSNLLKWNKNVYKECFLTTFSLNPNYETYSKIVQIAGEVMNICQYHTALVPDQPVIICEKCGVEINKEQPDNLGALLAITGNPLVNDQTYDPFFVPSTVLDSDWSDIPVELIADITTLINSPRVKNLSWSMSWDILRQNCASLLVVENKLQLLRQQYQRANSSLKFIKLDTRNFHHLPEQDCPGGVENGYEDDEESDEEDIVKSDDPDFKTVEPIKKKKIRTEVKPDVAGPSTGQIDKKKKPKKEVVSTEIDSEKLTKKRGRKKGSKNGTITSKYICTRKPGERRGRKPKQLILFSELIADKPNEVPKEVPDVPDVLEETIPIEIIEQLVEFPENSNGSQPNFNYFFDVSLLGSDTVIEKSQNLELDDVVTPSNYVEMFGNDYRPLPSISTIFNTNSNYFISSQTSAATQETNLEVVDMGESFFFLLFFYFLIIFFIRKSCPRD